MDSNTYSTGDPEGRPGQPPDGPTALAAAVTQLAAEDRGGLSAAARAARVRSVRRLLDCLEGHWLAELADLDTCGAAGAEAGVQVGSTAGWLRTRLRMGANAAHRAVRTARAVFRGPLTQTAHALTNGEVSVTHASVLAHGTQDLPAQVTAEAEPVLLEAARRLDPGRLRQVIGHLQLVADPDRADRQTQRRHGRRGLWTSPPWTAWSPSTGSWNQKPARPSWPPWHP